MHDYEIIGITLIRDCCLIVAEEFMRLCDPESYADRSNSSR